MDANPPAAPEPTSPNLSRRMAERPARAARRRWRLRTYLLAYGVVLLLPALATGGAAAWQALGAYRAASDLRLRDTARSLAGAIDGDLGALLAVARSIAASPLLAADDELAVAANWARSLQSELGTPIVVNDAAPGYRQLFNTRLPPGAPLPLPSNRGEGSWDLFETVVATRSAAVSDLFTGRVAGRPVLSVAAPVLGAAGEVRRIVVLAVDPERLSATLRVPDLRGGAYAGVADGNGRIVARSRDLDRWLGTVAPGRGARAALAVPSEEVPLLRLPTPEGSTAVVAVTGLRSAPGWTLAVAQPVASYEAPWRRPLYELGLGATVLLALSLTAAALLSRSMKRQLEGVVRGATAFGRVADARPQPPGGGSSVAEFDALGASIRGAADALVEREAELRLVTDALPVLVSHVDRDGRYRFVNRGYEEWFGHAREDVVGRHLREVLGEGAYEAIRPHVEAALAGTTVRFEARVPYKDGGVRDIEASYVPRPGADGAPDGFYALVADITARKAAEDALREAGELAALRAAEQAAILGQLAEGVIVTDREGRITFVNEAAERLHGVGLLGIAPDNYAESYHLLTEAGEPHPPLDLPLARAVLRGETVADARWRIRRPDGSEVLAIGSARPILNVDGVRTGAVLTVRDDTARRAAEDGLREGEARLRALADNLPAGLVYQLTMRRDGSARRFTFVSGGCERLTGVSAEAAMADPGALYATILPESREALAAAEEEAIRRLAPMDVEAGYRRADGSPGSCRIVSAPRTLPDGSLGWDGMLIDVTDRHAAEAALRELNRTLETRVAAEVAERAKAEEALRQAQKMEAVGQLTGGLAHDVNNMLQGIGGALQMMEKRIAGGRLSDLPRLFRAARDGVDRAAAITHRLLAFARRGRLDPSPVNVDSLVGGMLDLVRRTVGPGIAIRTRLRDGDWIVRLDPSGLESALLNLAINARDAMPDGGTLTFATGEVRLAAADLGADADGVAPGDFVLVSVSDTGTGMPPDVIARAFEPFFTTKPIGKGTGLGLSQLYGFVRQSGGLVRIESAVGRGTTVRLYLPRAEPAPSDAEVPASAGPVRAEAGVGSTVLLVEDEAPVRSLVAETLRDRGYAVLEAEDGPSGLAALAGAARIDLLVTDVGLPGLNGRQMADAARERRPTLPVLFITGYAGTALDEGLSPGMAVIAKPFSLDLLAERVAAMRAGEGTMT